jgi:hypothetical protein
MGSAPAPATNYVMRPDMTEGGPPMPGGRSALPSNRLGVVTGRTYQCKAACDANIKCTHFTKTGSTCVLYSGPQKFLQSQSGTDSYCKSQCQGGAAPAPAQYTPGKSGYAMEGSPFGGVVGGRNWKLIMTLLVIAILLWILAKNI